MNKVLRVTMEAHGGASTQTMYIRLKKSDLDVDYNAYAEAAFFDWANYGFDAIDESEVPEGEEIL